MTSVLRFHDLHGLLGQPLRPKRLSSSRLIVWCVVNRDGMVIFQNMYSKNCIWRPDLCHTYTVHIVIDWQPENRVILKLQFLAQRRLRISSGLPTGASPSMAFLRYHMQTRTAIWRRFVRKVSIASTWNTFETFLSNLCANKNCDRLYDYILRSYVIHSQGFFSIFGP